MLRSDLKDALNTAMKEKNGEAVSTIRLILAALKDRDIAARSKGNKDGVPDSEVLTLLQSMVKQREESAALYEQGGRKDLADQERGEIEVIRNFLPEPMSEAESGDAVDRTIAEVGATNLKDMGSVMAALRESYPGRLDFSKVGAMVKQRLA